MTVHSHSSWLSSEPCETLDRHTQSTIACRQRHWHREDEWSINVGHGAKSWHSLKSWLILSLDDHRRHLTDVGFHARTNQIGVCAANREDEQRHAHGATISNIPLRCYRICGPQTSKASQLSRNTCLHCPSTRCSDTSLLITCSKTPDSTRS